MSIFPKASLSKTVITEPESVPKNIVVKQKYFSHFKKAILDENLDLLKKFLNGYDISKLDSSTNKCTIIKYEIYELARFSAKYGKIKAFNLSIKTQIENVRTSKNGRKNSFNGDFGLDIIIEEGCKYGNMEVLKCLFKYFAYFYHPRTWDIRAGVYIALEASLKESKVDFVKFIIDYLKNRYRFYEKNLDRWGFDDLYKIAIISNNQDMLDFLKDRNPYWDSYTDLLIKDSKNISEMMKLIEKYGIYDIDDVISDYCSGAYYQRINPLIEWSKANNKVLKDETLKSVRDFLESKGMLHILQDKSSKIELKNTD